MKGTFVTRKEAVNDAKADLFRDWFVLIGYSDGSFDYACPGRPIPATDRDLQVMYQRARHTGHWYIARR